MEGDMITTLRVLGVVLLGVWIVYLCRSDITK